MHLPGVVHTEEAAVVQHERAGVHTVPPRRDLRPILVHPHHRAEAQDIVVPQGPVVREVPVTEVQAEAHREVQDTEVLEVVPEVQEVSVVPVVHSDLRVVADQVVVAVPEEAEADNNSEYSLIQNQKK